MLEEFMSLSIKYYTSIRYQFYLRSKMKEHYHNIAIKFTFIIYHKFHISEHFV